MTVRWPSNGWVKIAADDMVTVMICKSEMGQGVYTSLPMLLAEELDADWDKVRIELSPVDNIYNNIATVVDGRRFIPTTTAWSNVWRAGSPPRPCAKIGVMATGGSSSIKDLWLPMRHRPPHRQPQVLDARGTSRGRRADLAHGLGGKPAGQIV